MKTKFKKGDQVKFNLVTKRYACPYGTVNAPLMLYTDNVRRFPDVEGNTDVELFFEDGSDRQPVQSYYVNAYDKHGKVREKVIVTEDFIKLRNKNRAQAI